MIENFASLDDIFADEAFNSLVEGIHTPKSETLHPEIEKFLEVNNWIKENGRAKKCSNQRTTVVQSFEGYSCG